MYSMTRNNSQNVRFLNIKVHCLPKLHLAKDTKPLRLSTRIYSIAIVSVVLGLIVGLVAWPYFPFLTRVIQVSGLIRLRFEH
jgi:hypothetical protein